MTNMEHEYGTIGIIDFVDDSIVAGSNSLAISPFQFLAIRGTRVMSQAVDCVFHSFEIGFGYRS